MVKDILLKPTNLFTHFDMIQTNLHIVLFVEEATKYVNVKLILPLSLLCHSLRMFACPRAFIGCNNQKLHKKRVS